MMNDVYVLNPSLQIIGLIDSHASLIWANRYKEVGDCELYVPANANNLALLQKNNYLFRLDDEMICIIKKVELTTDPDDGNYLTITGYDVKSWLDQRVIWGTMTANGNAEDFVREMVDSALGSTAADDRALKDGNGVKMFFLGASAGFTDVLTEQTSYKNIGEKVRDYCNQFGWGYRVTFDSANSRFLFTLYKGADRADSVVFSRNYENLRETDYIEDETNMGNVALIAGEGEGSARFRTVAGVTEGLARHEIYVDAKDISKTITYADLKQTFPLESSGGQGYWNGNQYVMRSIGIQILDAGHLERLQRDYPGGTVVTVDGVDYYQLSNQPIAECEDASTLTDNDNVRLYDLVYEVYLLSRGYEDLAEYGAVTSFNGTVEPNTTFVFKEDYFLGDIVTVENEYGITVAARIVEVVEVSDDNGYYVEPKFEYIQED